MDINTVSFSLAIGCVLSLISCKECEYKPTTSVSDFRYHVSPEQRTYRVGDTIYFFSSTSDSIFPTGYDPETDEIVSQISVYQYHDFFGSSVYTSDAAKKFKGFMIKGTEYPNPERLQNVNIIAYNYLPEADSFAVEVGVVLRDTGTYSISPGSVGLKINKNTPCEIFFSVRVWYNGDNNNWTLCDSLNNVISTPTSRRTFFTFNVKPK